MQKSGTSALPPAFLGRLEEWAKQDTFDVPLLPEAAQEAMRAATNEETDARKLADIIRRDPSLSTHLLRVANSPLYGGRTRILSLQQAISRLGMTTLRQMALAIACGARIFRVKGQEARVREMFRHCLATSFVAQEAARLLKRNVEEAFLAGLLHDIGRPLTLEAAVGTASDLGCEVTGDLLETSMDLVHARVGATVARAWGFLPGLVDTIRHHHDPEQMTTSGNLAALVALADDVAHHLLESRPVDLAALESHPSLRAINLYPEDLDKLLAHGPDAIAWAEAFA